MVGGRFVKTKTSHIVLSNRRRLAAEAAGAGPADG